MKTRVDLKLGGKVYHLVPGPRALMRIAEEVGDPAQMAVGLSLGRQVGKPPPLTSVVKVFDIALSEIGHEFEKEELWALIHKAGLGEVFNVFAVFIAALVNKGIVPEDEDGDDDAPPGNRKARRAKKAVARKGKAKA